MLSRKLWHWVVALAVAKALIGAAPAPAQTFTWNVTNGSFQNPNSWTPLGGPPGAGFGQTANFAGPSNLTNYLATFDSDWAVFNLQLNQGTTTFGLNGHTFGVNNLFFGNNASQTTTLNLTNGTFLAAGAEAFANGTNSTFTLTLDRATFSANNYTDFASGTGSTFNLNVRNGSTYSALGNSFVGITGAANVTVDGASSSLTLGQNSRIGNAGNGTITVQNGGALHTTGALLMAANSGVTGTVNLTGAGSNWTHTDGFITTGSGATNINVNGGSALNIVGTGAAAGININSNGFLNVSGAVNITGVGQSGINLNAGILSLNTNGSITTDYFTRSGTAGIALNDGLLAINKQLSWNSAPFTISGTAGGDPVVQLQNGATTSGLAAVTLGATIGQRGTLRVLSGSTASFGGTAIVGGSGPGTLLIDGAGSSVTSTQPGGTALTIGSSALGTATVQNGGSYSGNANTSIVLGANSGSSGLLTVSGANSSVSTGGMSVGQSGAGTVNVVNGGVLSSVGSINIGENASGVGTMLISGPGSALNDGFSLFIGGTSAVSANNGSQVTISNGATASAAMGIGSLATLWNGSSLTINGGGSLTVGGFTRLGTLNLDNGTLTIAGFFANTNSPSPLTIQGLNPGNLATLQITNGATTSNIAALTVGGTRAGAVNVTSGGILSTTSVSFASSNSGNGSISLSGPGSTLNVNGPMTFGSLGSGAITVGSGSTANVNGTLSLGSAGTINLNGGTLNIGTFTPNGGAFNWSSGAVAFTGTTTLGSTELSTLLGPSGAVSAGRTLKGSTFSGNPLTVTGNLTVNGGLVSATEFVNAATMAINSGSVQATTQITNNAGSLITVANGGVLNGLTFNNGEIQFGGGSARLTGNLVNSGRVTGSGTVSASLTNNASGRVIVDAGQRLVFGGASNSNNSNGSIEMTGGTVEFTGQLNNATNGLISGRGVFRGSSANVSGNGLLNNGAVAFSAGTSDVYGRVTNTGNGNIVTVGGGTTTFHDDMIHNGAEIRTASGARTVFLGAETGAGNFTGTGTVEFQGDLRPGNSPALINFAGDMELGHSAKLNIEIGGTVPGMNFDQLNVANRSTIDGALSVSLINGFTPVVGQRFDIILFGSEQGNFSNFIGLNIGAGLALQPGIDSHAYFLTVTPVPEPTSLLMFGAAVICGWHYRRRLSQA
jgi:T5SS/PEP-CTERM-associated repeat protein